MCEVYFYKPATPKRVKPFDAARYIKTREGVAELARDAAASGHPGYMAAALRAIGEERRDD